MINEPKSVLVVDDVRDWQLTLRGLLIDAGFLAQVANSTEEALSLCQAIEFDMAVIDVRLDETADDDTSGITLARDLKASYPVLKIILTTGYETTTMIRTAFAPGDDGQPVIEDFFSKTRTDELVARVRELLKS